MANSDKNILITPSVGQTAEPTIKFTGANNTPTTLRVLDDGTVSFEGTAGQLFSISDGLSGTIFSVNDISGIPSIEVLDTGEVRLAQYNGNVGIGMASPSSKLHITAPSASTIGLIVSGAASHSVNLQEWRNSAGTAVVRVDNGFAIRSTAAGHGYHYNDGSSQVGRVVVYSDSVGTVPFISRGIAGQTGDLQQWQNSAGTNLVTISPSGVITSSLATGTAPLSIASTTLVSNLNADYLDGNHGSYYLDTSATAQTKAGDLTISGNLTVNGTTTTINSTTISVDDKNIELGSVASPTNTTADGGGITLKGATDKTFNWVNATGSWTSSEDIDLASGKVLKFGGTQVLSASAYTGSAATLTTGRTIGMTGDVVWTSPSFNGSTNITSTSTIQNDVVTYAKMQNVSAQYRVLGRISASAGDPEELTPDNMVTLINQASTAIAATEGGTGQTSYTIGDILYASSTSALAKLAGVATGNALISGGVGTAPSWGKIGLTTHISGTLPVANGGTGVTTSTGSGNVVLSTSPTLTTPNIGAASGTSLSATGNISGSTLTSTVATGTAPLTVTSTTAVTNFNADYLDGRHGTDFAYNGIIAGSSNFNSQIISGTYRFNNLNTNGPGFDWGQVLIMRGLDTISQLAIDFSTATIKVRAGNPTEVGGGAGGAWTAWRTVWADHNDGAGSGLDADLLDGLQGSAYAVVSGNLSQFAATTSAQLAGIISDETGSGALVFATSPTLTTPNIGAASGTSLSATGNISGSTLTSTVATGTSPLTITSTTKVSNLNADLFDDLDSKIYVEGLRANKNLSGGGTISVDASYNISWSNRFIVISNGRSATTATAGYWDINVPAASTVITGVGGATNQTVSASGISLGAWHALYYILPFGSGSTSIAANFRLALYTADLDIPPSWILIAFRNGDDGYVYFNNGVVLTSGQSSITTTISSNTANAVVKRDASGNFSAGTITANLSGNASTVTNGVYTTGSYSNPSWIASLSETKVLPSQTGNSGKYLTTNGTSSSWTADPVCIAIAISDETTAITTGTAKVTFRMPWAMTVTAVRASLSTASTSGNPTFDINEGGTSILGANKLSIDANEKTSTTATTATTIADSALADDAEITIDVDTAGAGAKGAKVYLIGTKA